MAAIVAPPISILHHAPMPRGRRRWTALTRMVAAPAACMALGCLPAGAPPAGQQLVSDRTLTYTFFSPSESVAVPSHLFSTGPYRTAGDAGPGGGLYWLTDLYAIPYGPGVGTSSLADLQPAVADLAPLSLSYSLNGAPASADSLGRLYLSVLQAQNASPYASPYGTIRYDPRTGVREPVSSGGMVRFSASRSRVYVGDVDAGTLFEVQGSRSLAGVSGVPDFIGEDFYFVATAPSDTPGRPPTNSTLARIKPNAEPEVLLSSSGFVQFTVFRNAQAAWLLIQNGSTISILDPDTLTSTSIPLGLQMFSFKSASPSGRWLLFQRMTQPTSPTEPPSQLLTLVDWTAGTWTDLDPEQIEGMDVGAVAEWRPGRDELWLETQKGAFRITEPGNVVTEMTIASGLYLSQLLRQGTDEVSVFTRDGQYWFAGNRYLDGRIYVGRADDPAGPLLSVNPEGTWTRPYWDVGDGRLLFGAWVDDETRQQLYLVDLVAGTSKLLASGGQLAAAGRTRALALLEWDGARDTGALTLIDLASGEKTLLAEEVYGVALDPGRPIDASLFDPLAPGTKLAFLTRGRLPGPYDGLWVMELP